MLGQRVRELLNSRKISIGEFAEMCDLPLETVRNIYYGRTTDPKVSTVMKMGNALNLSVNCLMGQCPHTKEEKAVVQFYRMCGSHGKSVIELVAKYEALAAREERESLDKHLVPCIVSNGNIHEGIDYAGCEVVEVETGVQEAFAAIKLTTNDLVPTYCKGDILLLANRFPTNGEYAVFYNQQRAYLRQFIEEENEYRLRCIHHMCEDIVLHRMDEIQYAGTCIGVIKA